jgi:hypothetical protein
LDTKGNYWDYDIVTLLHNHKLHPESRMVRFMQSHKNMEDGIKNLMNMMTRAGVQHQAQMNVMSELHGGRDNWQFTVRDVKIGKELHTYYVFFIWVCPDFLTIRSIRL